MMKHVQQRGMLDCGLAVAAMLTGASYDDAWEQNTEESAALNADQLAGLLRQLLGRSWTVECVTKISVVFFAAKNYSEHPMALLIRRPFSQEPPHWVAIDADLIHDPHLTKEMLKSRYDCRTWEVLIAVRRRAQKKGRE